MASRPELQTELEEVLGSRNVYFQPPESKRIEYDAIVYNRSTIGNRHANNKNYFMKDCYEVTLIYRNPDSDLAKRILNHFEYSSFNRHFTADNLNHDVITIYY